MMKESTPCCISYFTIKINSSNKKKYKDIYFFISTKKNKGEKITLCGPGEEDL